MQQAVESSVGDITLRDLTTQGTESLIHESIVREDRVKYCKNSYASKYANQIPLEFN